MLSIEDVKCLRLFGQHLTNKTDKRTVVQDLLGLQSQFMSNASHGLKIRCYEDVSDSDFGSGLVKNWTIRGTVHVFAKEDLPLFVRKNYRRDDWSLPTWWNSRPDWSLTPERQKYFSRLILDSLADSSKSREELKEICSMHGMTEAELGSMFHPWGGGVRELCERGFMNYSVCEQKRFELCHEYEPLPDEIAEKEILRRYFTNFSPATIKDSAYFFGFTQTKIKDLMSFLPVNAVYINGVDHFYIGSLPDDLPGIPECVLLSGFDQLMLGYKKDENIFLSKENLRGIFSLSGIVMPAILLNGHVVGRWKHKNGKMNFELFEFVSNKDKNIITETASQLFAVKNVDYNEI